MNPTLTKVQLRMLIPNIPVGSDIVYWRTAHNLAADRRTRPDLDEVATLLRESAERGAGHLFQRRRRRSSFEAEADIMPSHAGVINPENTDAIVTDYCFRKGD